MTLNCFYKNSKFILLSLLLLNLVFCSSPPKNPELEGILPSMGESEYKNLIEKNTQTQQQYKGFYNLFTISVTQQNAEVAVATLQRKAHFMQWDLNKAQSRRKKMYEQLAQSSQFFITFFTPNRKLNELDRRSSMWKGYLEVNGTRYEARFKAFKNLKSVQIKNSYPHYNRFTRAYWAEFNIPMNELQNHKAKFIITSSLGQAQFEFMPSE